MHLAFLLESTLTTRCLLPLPLHQPLAAHLVLCRHHHHQVLQATLQVLLSAQVTLSQTLVLLS